VIDASVLVKWYIQENDSDKALLLRNEHVNGEILISAPALISYETTNALKYSNLFSTSQLKEIALSIQSYGLSLHAFDGETAELAIEASQKNDITIYDGSYLGLAKKLGVEFITADQKLINKLTEEYARTTRHL
jgi:predicted nucleic acid-binding protein